MLKRSLLALVVLLPGACASSHAVTGAAEDLQESFAGQLNLWPGGEGELRLLSSRDTACMGSVRLIRADWGEGWMHCEDNRSGPVYFRTTETGTTAALELDARPITLAIAR